MGLGVGGGGGGVDVREGADLSGAGDDGSGLGGGGLDGWFVKGSPGFAESSGKTSETVSNTFSISAAMGFWSAWKGEVVNVV